MKKIYLNTDKKYRGFYINEDKFIFLYKDKIDEYDNELNYIKSVDLDKEYDSVSYNNNMYLSKDNNIYIYKDKIEQLDLIIEDKINSLNFYQKKLIVCNNKIYLLTNKLYKIIDDKIIDELLSNNKNNKLFCATYNDNNLYVIYSNNEKVYISNISDYKIITNKYYLGKNIKVLNSYMYKYNLYLLVEMANKQYIYIIERDNYCDNCLELIKCLCSNKNIDIITSIAMVENSIAKILDVEAKKIQKTLSLECDINSILRVNDSVNEMIKRITTLEQILCSKLEIYLDILKEKDKKNIL